MNHLTKHLIILSCTPYFGNSRFQDAIEKDIAFNKIIQTPNEYKKTLRLREETIDFLNERKYLDYLNKIDKWLLKDSKNNILTYFDSNYPRSLKEIHNPPFLLYCIGKLELLETPQIAIVGARNNSTYGKNVTQKLCQELSNAQISITSGLAYGIDTLAHKYALECDLNTIAVVGTGVDIIYPSSNRELYNKIINNNGLIISEFQLGSGSLRHNFPQRNRIISGLSKGVIIVEAASRSGSLITAQLALEQNKEVFAIPGSIFSKTSQGCNDLIKQGAKLVNNTNDIFDEIDIQTNISKHDIKADKSIQGLNLSPDEKTILEIINKELTTLDKIVIDSKLPYHKVTEILFELELRSLVDSIPGGYINTAEI